MKISTTTAVFDTEIERVWEIVTNNAEWEWRSDLSKIEITAKIRLPNLRKTDFPPVSRSRKRKNTNGTNSTWTTKTFRAIGREFSVRRAKNKRR